MARNKNGIMCGIVEKVFNGIANFFSYIDTVDAITITDVDEYSATLNYNSNTKVYSVLIYYFFNYTKFLQKINILADPLFTTV